MDQAVTSIPNELEVVLLRDISRFAGVSERTLKANIERRGFRVVRVTPTRFGVLRRDYEAYLEGAKA